MPRSDSSRTSSPSSAGIMTRTARSSPRLTPRATTNTAPPRNSVCHSPVLTQLPVRPLKVIPTLSASAPANAPEPLSKMYATAHPAMTL